MRHERPVPVLELDLRLLLEVVELLLLRRQVVVKVLLVRLLKSKLVL